VSRASKLGLVLGGYVAAPVAAFALVWMRSMLLPADPDEASGGMQAFGDLLLFFGLWFLFSLVPTALALFWLREFPRLWMALAIAALIFAATGPVAAALVQRTDDPLGAAAGLLGLPRVLGAPLLAVGFAVCALIAPTGRARGVMLAAAAIEGAVGVYMVLCLFVLGRWLV